MLTTYGREADCVNCLLTLLPQKTDNIEILLLDDLHTSNDKLRLFCSQHGIKYVHTGKQKNNKVLWRVPGFALNIGAKLSKGDYLILGNAEIYQVSQDTVSKMFSTGTVAFPRVYDQPNSNAKLENYKQFPRLRGDFPFFMGVPRTTFYTIGGYDEDFIGYAWEDTDLCYRLALVSGNQEVDAEVIHVWNERGMNNRSYATNLKGSMHEYNKKLFYERQGIPVRNIGKDWGVFNEI